MLFSTEPPQVSPSKNVLETQDSISSSTLSTGQSYAQNASFQPGSTETYTKRGENCVEPSLPSGNPDYQSHQVHIENNQSPDWVSYPLAAPCFGRTTAVYDPNAVVYPRTMGITPARVGLPLDCTQGIPIYVNAKQYHAILRRRVTRAKLEAQNKAAKSRKPYLHESRHRHALRRARGSGGRFLNTKNAQQSNPYTQISGKNLFQQTRNEPDMQYSESNSWGTSTTSDSDASCIFNIFQPPDSRDANFLTMGVSQSHVVAPEDMLLLPIDRCARISTAS